MKIHVLLSPHNVDDLYFTNKTTVVIDVLRATSVIVTALKNGAKELIPVNTVEFGMKISGDAFSGQTLIGGERNTKKIDGFNLGNSPLEYTEENVNGKSIILYTTNGSKAIVKAKFSENLFIASFNNLDSVVNKLIELDNDLVILCAGSSGMFCIEDTVCAGKLISRFEENGHNISKTDAAKASIELFKSFGQDIKQMLLTCEHGKLLAENGFESDLDYCSQLSIVDVIPAYNKGTLMTLSSLENSLES